MSDILRAVDELRGPKLTETEVYIMGYPVTIAYTIHEPSYVEWKIRATTRWEDEHDLLNVLLRIHYAEFIEAVCREHSFYVAYADAQGAPETEDIPF